MVKPCKSAFNKDYLFELIQKILINMAIIINISVLLKNITKYFRGKNDVVLL
tara:strand:- start:17399 stop:17554 length:156 start_codon:yes stop_codon:yes gene_type:complete